MLRLHSELDRSGPEQRDYSVELGLCISFIADNLSADHL